MVATSAAKYLLARTKRVMVEYDQNGSDNFVDLAQPQAGTAPCLPIAGYRKFCVGVFRSVAGSAGGVTTVKLGGATAADGTGFSSAVTITPTTADGLGDVVWFECDLEQIREVVPTATHVGVKIDNVDADAEQVIFFEMADAPFQYSGLTADFIG